MSGLLDLCRSTILAFPFVIYFDEDGADQAFEWFCVWEDVDFAGASFDLLLDTTLDGV